MDGIKVLNELKNKCRICLGQIDEISTILLKDVKDMVMQCTSIQVNEDFDVRLPDKICAFCFGNLKVAFELRETTVKTEIQLEEILSTAVSEDEDAFYNDFKKEVIDFKEEDLSDTEKDDKKDILNEVFDHTKTEVFDHTETEIPEHIETEKVDEKDLLNHTCQVCSKVYNKRWKLNRHMKTHSDKYTFPCLECHYSYKTEAGLRHHLAAVHTKCLKRSECDICGKSVLASCFKKHLDVHQKTEKFPCHVCQKILHTEKTLESHIRIVHEHEQRKYRELCTICGVGIGYKKALAEHLLTHTVERPFKCDKCDKAYRSSVHLRSHVRSVHLDLRPHVCETCGNGFHSRKTLTDHIRRHTGERPFKCRICEKDFSFDAARRTHMKVHGVRIS